MNYLEKKKKAMLNYVSGATTEVSVVTHSTSGVDASLDVTVDGVTTNYSYSQLATPLDLGICALSYNNFKSINYSIQSQGDIAINGTPLEHSNYVSWRYDASVNYEIIGTKTNGRTAPPNKVLITTYSTSGVSATIDILDSESEMYKVYDDKQTYNKEVQVYYSNGWKVKANQDVEYNGATYHSGDMVEQWAYNVTKDIEITIL